MPRYSRVMDIQEWLPHLSQGYRRWIESHPYSVLAEPVLLEIAEVGGPGRDDEYWLRDSLWGDVAHNDPRFLPRAAVEWISCVPGGTEDPGIGKSHPSAEYFKNRGRWK